MTKVDGYNFTPTGKRVLVKRDDAENEKGGILTPKLYQVRGWFGTIVDCGSYWYQGRILFLKDGTILPFKDRSYALTDIKSILAEVIVENNIEKIFPIWPFVMIRPDPKAEKIEDIHLPDKSKVFGNRGKVYRVNDLTDYKSGVFYHNIIVECMENNQTFHIVNRDDILATIE